MTSDLRPSPPTAAGANLVRAARSKLALTLAARSKLATFATFATFATMATFATLTTPAHAQDLFSVPGHPALVPITRDAGSEWSAYRGHDDAGFLYFGDRSFTCYHPSAPEAVYTLDPGGFFDANGTSIGVNVFAAPTPDGSAFDVAFVPIYPYWQTQNLEAMRLFRVRCQDLAPGGPGPTRLGGTLMRRDDPLLAYVASADAVRLPTGFCFVANAPPNPTSQVIQTGPSGITCVNPSTTPPTITQLLDSATLDAALQVDPSYGFTTPGNTLPELTSGWTLSGLTLARDRVFFVAERFVRAPSFSVAKPAGFYVVERLADGTLRSRLGPVPESTSLQPLTGLGHFTYSTELDAVVAPVIGQEHNWEALANAGAANWGWTGIGLRVIPLDAPGTGYLPLSRVVLPRLGCEDHVPYCNRLGGTTVREEDGALQLTLRRLTANPNLDAFDTYRLTFDEASLDLDDDGLSAAQEATLGTWDTVSDSDQGGSPDGLEVDFAHSDPLTALDEPARQAGVRGAVRYVPSPLIGQRLSGVSIDRIRIERPRTVGIDGPLCVDGQCWGPGGVLVATYPIDRKLPGSSPVVSADGTFVMLRTAAGLERFFFDDAREDLAVPAATLDTHIPTWTANDGSLHVLPLDATRTLLVSDGLIEPERYPAIVLLAGEDANGPTVQVLYDHAQAQRDSGLAVATSDLFAPLDLGVMASIEVIGWNADTERLHLGVRGNWDSWLITIGLDGSAKLLGRGRALKGLNDLGHGRFSPGPDLGPPPLPGFLLPTGHGDYLAGGGVMEPFGGYLPAQTTFISNMVDLPPLAFWGDVLMDTVCCGFNEDGLYELVRYDRSVSPGDVLFLQHLEGTQPGAMLYKSGPRGGLAELWPSTLPGVVDLGGIDLAPDGSLRLCIADRGQDVVWELEPAGPDGVPELVRYTADVPNIRDCGYDAAGHLSVLAVGPARVLTRDGDFGDLAVTETLPTTPEPIELLRQPDGTNVVRVRDGLRGKLTLSDGRVVTMRESDMVVRIDDVPLPQGDFGERLVYQSQTIDYGPTHPARVTFAVRADGALVVAPHDGEQRLPYALIGRLTLVGATPDDYTGPLGVGGYLAHEGIGLVVVPGGSDADPWTGERPSRTPRSGPTSAAPTSSDPTWADVPPPPEDDGCGGGPTPGFIGLGLAWLATLRRRTPPTDVRRGDARLARPVTPTSPHP